MRQLSLDASGRTTIATLIFVLCCLLSSVRVVRDAPKPGHFSVDDIVERSDRRFGTLKAALPRRGVVGYVGESGNLADYYLTQYTLAPLIVDHSANHPLVVGNFPASSPPPAESLRLLKDFGNGVLLFAKKDVQ